MDTNVHAAAADAAGEPVPDISQTLRRLSIKSEQAVSQLKTDDASLSAKAQELVGHLEKNTSGISTLRGKLFDSQQMQRYHAETISSLQEEVNNLQGERQDFEAELELSHKKALEQTIHTSEANAKIEMLQVACAGSGLTWHVGLASRPMEFPAALMGSVYQL